MKENFLLLADAYKHTHWMQTPDKTEVIKSYMENRGTTKEHPFDYNVVMGNQMLLKRYFEGPVVEKWMIEEADDRLNEVFGQQYLNRKGWELIVNKYGGNLPIEILGIPEGTILPKSTPIFKQKNNDHDLAFLTNFCETVLLNNWFPISVATLSHAVKTLIDLKGLITGETCTEFHMNDFGARGVTCPEQAGMGGAAFLTSFSGTDNLNGITYAKRYYGGSEARGHSVFATEHSTTTIYGRENEMISAHNNIMRAPKNAIISLVSDSYNTSEFIRNVSTKYRDIIIEKNLRVVFRPDSGDPVEQAVNALNILWEILGDLGTTNAKGFKMLPWFAGVIYGDGINYFSIGGILDGIIRAGFGIGNIVFGSGGALLQMHNRDSHKSAIKCCEAQIDSKIIEVYKDPITDQGKQSKRGDPKVVLTPTGYITLTPSHPDYKNAKDEMVPIFKNGELLNQVDFNTIKNNIKASEVYLKK